MTFPAVRLDIHVELFIDDAWVDITNLKPTYNFVVAGFDGFAAIKLEKIIRGTTQSAIVNRITFSGWDPDGVMDTMNPYSPYYGKIVKGTQVRILIGATVALLAVLDSVSTEWDATQRNVLATFECFGATVAQIENSVNGGKPVKSPGIKKTLDETPLHYWPLEEGPDATRAKNLITGGPDLTITTTHRPAFGQGAGLTDCPPILKMANGKGQLHAIFSTPIAPPYGIEWVQRLPANESDSVLTANFMTLELQDGTLDYLDFFISEDVNVIGWDHSGTGGGAVGSNVDMFDGELHHIQMDISESAGTVTVNVYVDGVLSGGANTFVGTETLGNIREIIINPFPDSVGQENLPDIGHIAIYSGVTPAATPNAQLGYIGELAGNRFVRLCEENGIAYSTIGDLAHTQAMGAQRTLTPFELLLECAQTDGGFVYDSDNTFELVFRTRRSIYTQHAVATFVYAVPTAHLSAPFAPTVQGPYDTNVTNSIEIQNVNGAKNIYSIPDGDFFHWTTEAPPNGVRELTGQLSINLEDDADLDQHAAWHTHLRSWKEKRFTMIKVLLSRDTFADDAELTAAVRAITPFNVIAVNTSGASRWIPQDEVRLLVTGYTRTIAQFGDTYEFHTLPADPWEVTTVDTSGTVLAAALDTDDTTALLATTLGPEWSEADEPYYIQMNGEAMKVTAISTATPAFVAAGTLDSDSNASLTPGIPAGMAAGGIMLLWATIRNSGTGTVNDVTGWNELVNFGNTRLFYRYWVSGDAAPTVAFTGGVANATTLARIFGFSGLGHGMATGTKAVPAATTQLNSSAQNIGTPAFTSHRDNTVFLHFAWKQDDWTSVAPLSGFTEMSDDPSVLGDDAAIHASYDLTVTKDSETAATDVVVTGGASAISRSVLVALRALQTATVTRAVNNVSVSHAALSSVHGWRMGVTGL